MISDILYKISIGQLLTEDEQREMREWFSSLQDAPEQLSSIFKGLSTISTLSQITTNMGTVNRGNFLSGDDGDYLDTTGNNPYTGVGMISPGLTVGSDQAAIFGMNTGVLQFWLSALTGKIFGGGGSTVLDEDGILINNAGDGFILYDSTYGEYAVFSLLPRGDSDLASLNILSFKTSSETNIATNGDFETGDFTGWTESDSAGVFSVAQEGYNNSYCLKISGHSFPGSSITQTISASAGVVISFRIKTDGNNIQNISIGGKTIPVATGGVWKRYFLLSQAALTSLTVAYVSTTGFQNIYIDNIVCRELTNGTDVHNVEISRLGTVFKGGYFGVGSKNDLSGGDRFFINNERVHFSLPITLPSSASISLGTSQNNYKPSQLNTYSVISLNPTADINITGINPKNSGDTIYFPRILIIENVGSYNITLTDEDASSSADYRFSFGQNIIISPKKSVTLNYAPLSLRWRLTGTSSQPKAETNANDIFRCDNPGGNSAFVGTIATLPGGATLTYNVTSGNEGAMVPTSTSQLAKMRLYNTTRGTSARISNCVTGTNTITLTANVPAGWVVGDTITIASQTVTGGGFDWVDLEITSGPTGKSYMFLSFRYATGVVADYISLHPFETYAATSRIVLNNLSTTASTFGFPLQKITSNVFSLQWSGSPTLVELRELGYLE